MAYNNIEVLPDTLRSLKKLRAQYVHDNLLRYAPEWITDFLNLEILDLSFNKLLSLPDLSEMPSLYEVDIQENDIDYVPWNLLDKPNLRLLLIRGNPFLIDKDDKDELRKKIDKKRTEGVVIID